MSTIHEHIRSLLLGDLHSLPSGLEAGTEETWIPAVFAGEGSPDGGEVEELFLRFLAEGDSLRGLAVLKIASLCGGDPDRLRALLGRALYAESLTDSGRPAEGPHAATILESMHPPKAWETLTQMELALTPLPGAETSPGDWILCTDAAIGLALVWRKPAGKAPSPRGSERRRNPRYDQHLSARCTLRGSGRGSGVCVLDAEVFDISRDGMRLLLDNRYGQVVPSNLRGRFLSIEIPAPDGRGALKLTGEVHWCLADTEAETRCWAGVSFYDTSPELRKALHDLISCRKGDQQFLWNLWESYAASAVK